MPDAPLSIPVNTVTGTIGGIWTPTNLRYIQSWLVGKIGETGERVFKHEFELSYLGETKNFGVVAEESASEAQIEDIAGWTAERTAKRIIEIVQRRGGRLVFEDLANRKNWDVRRELAGAWREYRKWKKKRKASSTGKTIYKGTA